MPAPFRIMEHQADVGITAYGQTMEQTFGNAALGMFTILSDLTSVDESETVEVVVKGTNPEELLFNLLDDLLYRFEVDGFLARRVEVKRFTKRQVEATAYGEEKSRHHHIKREIKCVTYHKMKVEQASDGNWKVQVYFDL